MTQKVSVVEGKDYYLRYAMPTPKRQSPHPETILELILYPFLFPLYIPSKIKWENETCSTPPHFWQVGQYEGLQAVAELERTR